MTMALDLIKDWGGFEKFIAEMANTGDVTVSHNITLTGTSGVSRQIDVLITHKTGLINHLVICDCKFWKASVKRMHVDGMITAVKDLGASKGVFFTTKGYQSGAKEMAGKNGIELFLVREPTDEEWGFPGRKVQL